MTKQHSTMRTMTPYCVFENELNHISMLNTQMVIFSSVGSFLLSVCITILITAVTLELPKLEVQLALSIASYVSLALSLVFYLLCGLSWWTKRSEWKNIQSSTRIIGESKEFQNDTR